MLYELESDHYMQLDDDIVEQLFIFVAIDWDFHQLGVTDDRLCHLHDLTPLHSQADLLIHAY